MSKRIIVIYLICAAVFIGLILIKKNTVTAKRNLESITTFSEWQIKGKPVVLGEAARRDVRMYTKVTVLHVSGNLYEGYVPKEAQEKISPGQAFYAEWEGGRLSGSVIDVAEGIDIHSGLFRVRLYLDDALETGYPKTIIAHINTEIFSGVICVPNTAISQKGEEFFLWAEEGGYAYRRSVTIKQRDGYGSIIASGLEEGQMVIMEGTAFLSEKDKVNIINTVKIGGDLR